MNKYGGLERLGHRICILGPSNSGKSTLARRLSVYLNIPCYHLDQIAHYPNTDWQRRPDTELTAEQAQIISQPAWIIDGNYKICLPERLAYATAVLWIDPPLPGCLWRYFWRSQKNDPNRPGRLHGSKREFGWELVRYTLFQYPKNRPAYQKLLDDYPHLRILKFNSVVALNRFYRDNQF